MPVRAGRHASSAPSPLERDLRAAVRGEVRFDPGSRAAYATDASNFRETPIGVVVPRDVDDVVRAVELCAGHDVPLLGRGGGTSLAGQCCNHAVVLDFSKYVRGVLDVDVAGRRARVLPGTVLDDLKHAVAAHGLTFGPDPSTHNHCTIGGMIGNNSCGVHALHAELHGPGPRTEDNVVSMEVLTYDGLRLRVGETPEAELRSRCDAAGRPGEIYRGLRALRDTYADEIRARFPDIPRRVSGYSLPALLPERGFHVAQALVGSESTCVTVLEATVALVPIPPHRALLVLGYEDVYAAGDDVMRVRALGPLGCEGVDRALIRYIRQKDMNVKAFVDLLPDGDGWLLVELGGDSAEEVAARCREAGAALCRGGRGVVDYRVVADEAQQAQLWRIRKAGLGATAFVPGKRDSWPGWEDSAVPPEHVGEYLRALRALYDRYGYDASLYGHFGQGCVHTRVDFGLHDRAQLDAYRRFTREAAELVLRFGGSLSGEHGDGQQRGDLLPLMFGERLMEAFREFRRIWDPRGRMNPGKLVDADPRDTDLRLAPREGPRWDPPTAFAYPDDDGSFAHAALRCVGVGECRKHDEGTMCPSYMVTFEEEHSTRGRARLLFELTKGDVLTDGWKSAAVADALDLCLSCKGCLKECPVSVDMATYKAEFLHHHYRNGARRPRHAYAFGLIDRWARLGSLVPGLANFATHAPGLRAVAKWVADVAPSREVPRFAPRTFRRWFRSMHWRGAAPPAEGEPRVLLWPDTFNDHFHPEVLEAGLAVLEHAGFHVALPPSGLCCGRPLYDYGMLDRARRYWCRILDALGPTIEEGLPIVGLEPSCVAAFRDELRNLLPDDARAARLASQVRTLGELLGETADYRPPPVAGRALVHGHCHHTAVMGLDAELALLSETGLEVATSDAGCCGMAGAFGFERPHYAVSVAVGERVLLPRVRGLDPTTHLVADGFSCREQIRQLTGRRARHTAQVLHAALAEGRDVGEAPAGGAARARQLPAGVSRASGGGSSPGRTGSTA